MTHGTEEAAILNEQFRDDALHSFVSGLKKSLKSAVFPAKPEDLPSALAIALEAEVSNDYAQFAASFARTTEERKNQKNPDQRIRYQQNDRQIESGRTRLPQFQRNQNSGQNNRDRAGPSGTQQQGSSQPSSQRQVENNKLERLNQWKSTRLIHGLDNQQTLIGPKLLLRAVKKLTI